MLNISKQTNNKKSKIHLSQTLLSIGKAAIFKLVEKIDLDKKCCGNKKNINKNLLLLF